MLSHQSATNFKDAANNQILNLYAFFTVYIYTDGYLM
jgi:hypothetical protein